jgi:hypothetical protein
MARVEAEPIAVVFRGGDFAAAGGIEFGHLEVVFSDGSREPRGWLPGIAADALAREFGVSVQRERLRAPAGSEDA